MKLEGKWRGDRGRIKRGVCDQNSRMYEYHILSKGIKIHSVWVEHWNCGKQRQIGGGKVIERYPLIWCLLYNKTLQHLVRPNHCYDHLEDKLGLDGHSHMCAWKDGAWVASVLSHNSAVVSGVFVGSNIQRAAEKSSFYAQVLFFFFQWGKDLFHLTDYLPPSREAKARGLKKRKPQREKYCLLARSFAHIQLSFFYNQGPPA